MNEIASRLAAVRAAMTKTGLDALIVPRADEYLGEYVPAHNERLRWISGFTGSAGEAIICAETAAIFVDGRYTIQVQQQVPGDLFEYRHILEDPPPNFLRETLNSGARVGIDTRLHSHAFFDRVHAQLEDAGMQLVEMDDNPIDSNWQNRPFPEPVLATLMAEEFTGEHSLHKRTRIGKIISDAGADAALITQLDSIAWLLNIRGADVPHLPVVLGTALLDKAGQMTFFTDPRKIPNDFSAHVGDGVIIREESEFTASLSALGEKSKRILADSAAVNAFSVLRCQDAGCHMVFDKDPVLLPKATKNPVELNGMRVCHVRDGASVSRYLAWIEREVAAGRFHDEAALADKLEALRREHHLLHDLSFDTISAAGANGAMCHYNHVNGTPATLSRDSLYLVDSGGQYSDGTTDITRTVAIGTPTDEHRKMFTLVLKGHIALATAVFPNGTTGVQLDVLARQYLWQEGLDYDHGTGHGVGSNLSVHEGPQRIGKKFMPNNELLPGMVLSNEPGYYKEGAYGIRCENLMIVRSREDNMLSFETITFAPFDLNLVNPTLMTPAEISWLNQYHVEVWNRLSDDLKGQDADWLKSATSPIH